MGNLRLSSHQREDAAASLGAAVALSASTMARECEAAIEATDLKISPRMRFNLFLEPLFAGFAFLRHELLVRYRHEDAAEALSRAKETAAVYVARYLLERAEDEDEAQHTANVAQMLEEGFRRRSGQYDQLSGALRTRISRFLYGRDYTAVKFLTQELNFRFQEDAIFGARDRNEAVDPQQFIPFAKSNNSLGKSVHKFVANVWRSIDEHSGAAA